MMIRQEGRTHEWVTEQKGDRILTLDEATREHDSMFFVDGTRQGRLPQEWALAGIARLAQAHRYLVERYRPAFNAEFAPSAMETGSAFVPWIAGRLEDTLCEQYERTVSADNCVRVETLIVQIPAEGLASGHRHRCHYVKAKVGVHRYASGPLAVFHGPRKLADYHAEGKAITENLKQMERQRGDYVGAGA